MQSNFMRGYTEVRQLIKARRAGKIDKEEYDDALKGHTESRKMLEGELRGQCEAARYTASMHLQMALKSAGLIGSGEFANPSIGTIEQETVLCEKQDKIITREECLDRSGSKDYFQECDGCETGILCKKLLVDNPMYQA